MNFKSVDELLDFAIKEEEDAARFYTRLSDDMDRPAIGRVFKEFAREELGHKQILLKIKQGKRFLAVENETMDLKIGDYLVDVQPSSDMDYQSALILAMKKEKASFKLYNDLALKTEDENLQSLLLNLAQEEAKHKLRLEIEYDEHYLD